MINIEKPQIISKETAREIVAADFPSLNGGIPISGGWGYSQEDAVVINKHDPMVSKATPFDGISIEYIFVEKRIYEELIIFRKPDDKYSGIRWDLQLQMLIEDGEKRFDKLLFDVTAIHDADWNELKAEWESNDGFQDTTCGLESHLEKKSKKTIRYTGEYWFDITSFIEY